MDLSSCTNNNGSNNNDIDKFILKYQNETFSAFNNVSISYRDSDLGDNIYMVAKQGGKFPPYVVHFSKRKNEVTSIDSNLLQQANCKSYFAEVFIKEVMNKFMKLDVKNLSVDSLDNVFITPFGEANTTLLRVSVKTNEKIIKKGYVYELYKDNWYINKRD